MKYVLQAILLAKNIYTIVDTTKNMAAATVNWRYTQRTSGYTHLICGKL